MYKTSLNFWNKKHFEEEELTNMNKHSAFVEWSMKYFPKGAKILELGAGTGGDTLFLDKQGVEVMATDFSKPALKALKRKANKNSQLETKQFDLSNLFPFKDEVFDIVYAHLVLHYFNKQTTQQIYDEIFRVLKPGGIVAVLLNSVTDPEYGTGKELEEDYFDVPNKGAKRYFSIESLKPFISKFEIITLDNKGSDLRRDHKKDLIRFIGKKR